MPPQHHIALRYFRYSQAAQNVLDACQNVFLALESLLDYIERLVTDIIKTFPPGKLPPMELVTERDKEELEVVLKGPAHGGKSIYSLGWPP